MKKVYAILALVLVFALLAVGYAEASISAIELSKYGNLTLSVSGSEFLGMGYAYGDMITVNIGEATFEMPVCTNYTDVPVNMPVCRVEIDMQTGEDNVALALNASNLAQAAGIAEKITIEEEPGYRWDFAEGVSLPLPIEVSLKEAGGYYDEWMLHALERSNNREDYPHLTDAQFANFREITTTGMGEGVLYRSSSPVNAEIGRSSYADAAAKEAGVRSIVNLADSIAPMQSFPGHYNDCNVIGLNLSVDFTAPDFEAGLAKGFRFIIENDGPYLIHCNEGKDRAGFASAILECLMGAGVHEVLDDYMVTYYNYYGVEPGSAQYYAIAEGNLKKSLEAAFDVGNLYAKGISLSDEAAAYMQEKLGLSAEEVSALKAKLS